MAGRSCCQRGQASVELVALLPFVVLAALVVWQLAVAGHALWSAGGAARAGGPAAGVGGGGRGGRGGGPARGGGVGRARPRRAGAPPPARAGPRRGADEGRRGARRGCRAARAGLGAPADDRAGAGADAPAGSVRPVEPRGSERGQAAVELVSMLPLLVVVGLALFVVLGAGVARELAGHAAEAGAMAILQDENPVHAARSAVPGWSRSRVGVGGRGRRLRPGARPRGPGPLARALTAEAAADARSPR